MVVYTLLLLCRFQQTVLEAAIQYNHEPIVRLLLEFGADANHKGPGCLPIHHAALGGQEAIVRLLLEYNADVNPLAW